MKINRLIPTYYYKSVDLIEVEKIHKLGYEYLLVDLDNTLTGFHHAYISKKGKEFLDKCKEFNLKIFIISNNNEKRCKKFCDDINVNYLFHSDKPFPFKILRFMKNNNIDKTKTIVIGDQIFTDILFASVLHVPSILVEPLTSKDLILTAINRWRDKKYRKYLRKNNLLKGISINE